MATGFIYIVKSVDKNYGQEHFHNVPTYWEDLLFFGPCKDGMRQRMNLGDYIFGVSPWKTNPRRVVFAMKIAERITFAEVYHRFPELRGPKGPIHVQPVSRPRLDFPWCDYQHIPDAMHDKEKDRKNWEKDQAKRDLDRFFVGEPQDGWFGRWLGPKGPEIDQDILRFLKVCSLFDSHGCELSSQNHDASPEKPIAFGRRYTGLHLEIPEPERFIELLNGRMAGISLDAEIGDIATDTTKHGRNRRPSCKSSC